MATPHLQHDHHHQSRSTALDVHSLNTLTHTMIEFPSEIWSLILEYACTDDGSTGRALSRVCKSFHTLADPFKMRSLHLTSASQIISLRNYLEGKTVHVYHLLIAFGLPSRDFQMTPFIEALHAVHTALSSTLISLSIHLLFLNLHTSVFPKKLTLPSLEELSVYGAFEWATCKLPALRRLNVSPPGRRNRWTEISRFITGKAPTTTHLYVTEGCLALADVERGLGLSQPGPQDGRVILLPPTLRTILVEVDIQRPRQPSPGLIHDVTDSLEDMKALAEKITVLSGVDVQLVFREAGQYGSVAAAIQDHKERFELGREGRWAVRPGRTLAQLRI